MTKEHPRKVNRLSVFLAVETLDFSTNTSNNIRIVNPISLIIAVSTHKGLCEKRLKTYLKRVGKTKGCKYKVAEFTMVMPEDTTVVRKIRDYKAHRTILFDFVKAQREIEREHKRTVNAFKI